jgi:hypothetical protein
MQQRSMQQQVDELPQHFASRTFWRDVKLNITHPFQHLNSNNKHNNNTATQPTTIMQHANRTYSIPHRIP